MTTTPDDPEPDGGVNRPDPPDGPADPDGAPAETGPLPLSPSNPRTRPETD